MPVNKASWAKTAVVTPFVTFQFNFMPFGLKHVGETFQRLMDQIFGDLDFVFVYLNDILISSGTKEEHRKHLRKVFDCLSKAGLAINLHKSKFFASKLEFLSTSSTPAASDLLQGTRQVRQIEAVWRIQEPQLQDNNKFL